MYRQSIANHKKIKPAWLLVLAAAVVVFIALADVWGHVRVADQLLFLASQIVYVLLPGFALLTIIKPEADLVRALIVSYLIGMGVVIGEYFLFYALGLQDYMLLCMSAVSALSVFALWRKRELVSQVRLDTSSALAYGALLMAFLFAVLAFTISKYNTPDVVEFDRVYLYQDMGWNVGNVTGIESGFPIMDIHVDGFTFGYHYFSNVFAAVFKNILGLSAYTIFMKLIAIVQVVVMTGGFYLLFSLLAKNKWIVAAMAGAAALCCQLLMAHMLWYAFASPISMGLVLGAAYYFIRFTKKMNTAGLSDGDFILFLILLAVATGTKTLLAAGVMAGAGLTILAQIFYKRQNIKNMMICGVTLLAVILVLFTVMVYGTHTFNHLQRAFAAIMTMNPPGYYLAAVEMFPALPSVVTKLVSYIIYMIENYLVLVSAAVLLVVSLNRRRPGNKRVKFFLLSGIIVGFVATSIIYQPGMSNLFFMEGTLPLCVFTLLYLLKESVEDKRKDRTEKIFFAGVVAVIIGFTIFTSVSMLHNDYKTGLPSRLEQEVAQPYDSISEGEYEGMIWLRDNTAKDAVFASDRQQYVPSEALSDARYYYYTAFSERQSYLEGYNYVSTHDENFAEHIDERFRRLRRVYTGDTQAVEELIADGVDYLMVTRFINPDLLLDETQGQVVFDNADITIYKLRGAVNK